MRRGLVLVPAVLVLVASAWIPLAPRAHAADHSFAVGIFSDTVDASIGNGKCKDSAGKCSLRAAVQEANALGGSTNITLSNPGTYTLTIGGTNEDKSAKGDIDISSSIKLYAPPDGGTATITGKSGWGDRIFDIPDGTPSMSVEFEPNLVIKGGNAPSGGKGGGIRSKNVGYLNLNQMTIKDSSADSGGGVYVTGPSTSLFNTNIVTFSGNSATGNGGGLDIEGDLVATLGRITVTGNSASQGGGVAAFLDDGSDGSASTSGQSEVSNNTATSAGGGMTVSRFYGTHFDITGNSAPKGGGLQLVGGNGPSMFTGRVYIDDNSASSLGGGVYASCKTASCGSLLQVSIENNTSTKEGGGLYVNGALTFAQGLVAGNTAGGDNGGGVVHIGSAALTMTNVTVAENKSTATGSPTSGGVVVQATVADTFTNDTIAENTGGSRDGVIVTGTGAVAPQVLNTIVTDTGTGTSLCNKALTSLGHNIDSGNSCGFTKSGDRSNTDPQVRVLSDNGGGVHTMMLQVNTSPALDAGSDSGCPNTDARWVMRPQDGDPDVGSHCDVGAYETGESLLNSDVGVTVTPSNLSPGPGSQVTYTVSFTNIGASGTFDSVVTGTAPSQLNLVSCTTSNGTPCSISGNKFSLVFPTIPNSGTLPTVTLVTIVGGSVGRGTAIKYSVVTWANNPDSNQENNIGSATVIVT